MGFSRQEDWSGVKTRAVVLKCIMHSGHLGILLQEVWGQAFHLRSGLSDKFLPVAQDTDLSPHFVQEGGKCAT